MDTLDELNYLHKEINNKIDLKKEDLSKGLYFELKTLLLWINDNEKYKELIRKKILIIGNIEILILNEEDKIYQNKAFEHIEKLCELYDYNKNNYTLIEFEEKKESKKLNFYEKSTIFITYINILIFIYLIINARKTINGIKLTFGLNK
jgi:hypothetical protein